MAKHAGVGGKFGADGTTEQYMDRLAEVFPFQIPEGAVDRADREHRRPFAAVNAIAIHDVPEAFGGEGIVADDEVTVFGVDDSGDIVADWTGQSGDTLVRVDLEKDGLDLGTRFASPLARLPVGGSRGLGMELRIDIDRADEPFFPERTVRMLDGAGDFAESNTGDLHARFPPNG